MKVENTFVGADGIGQTIEQRLWKSGITHWDEFSPSCQGVGDTRAEQIQQFIDGGKAALRDDDARYFDRRFPASCQWRLYESFADQVCFFDIETTGLDHRSSVVTTVTTHQNGTTQTLVRDDDLTADALCREFQDASVLVTFNGSRFDIPFLENSFGIELDHPHIDLMGTCNKLGYSGGLSAVESQFGIERELPDVDGREAVRLWYEHERGVDGALDRLIEYNREDTENMVPLLEQAVEELDAMTLPH